MISKTKFAIDPDTIRRLFARAGIQNITNIAPLGAGEYNAVFSACADGRDYVLKIAPSEEIPVLTYEHNIMEAELFWYEQMRTKTSVRVPKIYYSDFSKSEIPTNWFIMEKLSGTQLDKTDFQTNTEKEHAQIITAEMAAEIHTIKNDKFGYIQNRLYDNWYDAIHSFVENLLKNCAAKGKTSKRGTRLLQYIDRYRNILEQAECTMVNFDIWAPNIMCRRENGTLQYAWIDPERSFWGDRILDFCCLEFMEPLQNKSKSLAAYNAVSDKKVTATKEERIRYAIGFAYLGLVMETEKYYRYSPCRFGWWRNVFASKAIFSQAFKELKNG